MGVSTRSVEWAWSISSRVSSCDHVLILQMIRTEKMDNEGKTDSNSKEVKPATSETLTQPLFRPLSAANVEELEASELESLCLSCHENVRDKLLSRGLVYLL